MSVIWKKIWRDVMGHKGRTVQVVLSIAVGVFALGLTLGMMDIMQDRMSTTWVASNPSHILVGVSAGVGDDTIRAISNLPGIEKADGMIRQGFRWKKNLDDPWQDAFVHVRDDYQDQRYDVIDLLEGVWPSHGTVVADRGSLVKYGISVGDTIYFEINEKPHALTIAGKTYSTRIEPAVFSSNADFYTTRREMEKLGRSSDYTTIIAALPQYDDEETAKQIALDITDRLEQLGIGHGTPETFDPEVHFFQEVMDGIMMVLVVMSVVTLLMSLFLVVNTITAIVTEQVPQIGIMKAVGAQFSQIFRIYVANVVVYIAIALAVAIPLGVLGSIILSGWMLGLFNMETGGLKFPLVAVLIQIGMGVVSPLLAALWPVTNGARTTVREAVSGYGFSMNIGLIERGLAYMNQLPPLLVITIANTFRKKGRLATTLVALVMGGAIFMMVMSVQNSMFSFFDDFLETYSFDVFIGFEKPQRTENIESLVGALPGVEYAEVLEFTGGKPIRRVDDTKGLDAETVEIIGISREGNAYHPTVSAGRFIQDGDELAIALNQNLAGELGVTVGDDVIVEINDEDTTWSVVGLINDINANQTASVVWLDEYLRVQGKIGRGSQLFVGTENTDPAYLDQFSRDLRDWLELTGKDVGFSLTSAEFKQQNVGGLMIIVYLLAVIAVLIAAVGGVGLSGALSISAMERQKEIGVMRAIGASGRAIGLIFVGEGLIIGTISWLVALPISYPLAWAFSKAIGSVIDFDFGFQYSVTGAFMWLAAVLVLSVIASGLPAWRASRTSVREVLAYA